MTTNNHCRLATLAALATLSLPLHAQSSVTLSGTLDVGIFHGDDDATRVGGISRSHFALTGTEDLGGGLAATLNLTSRFHIDTGTLDDSKALFGGESTVGLKGAFGHVRFGRALTSLRQEDWHFDPWYNYDTIASPAWWLWHASAAADPNFSATGVSFARLNNGVFYDSPSFGGVTTHLSYGVERLDGDKTHSVSGALLYNNGPIALMASMERTPVDNRVVFLAGKYATGPLELMAAYDRETLANGILNRSYTVAAKYAMGVWTLSIGYGRQQDYQANFFGVGAMYAFSKRTNVYLSAGNKGKNLWGRTNNRTAFGMGINHTF